MQAYRRLRILAVAALLIEFIVGLGGYFAPRQEIFPFATWFLFSLVPGPTSDYDLVLRTVNDQPLDPPPRFGQASRYVRTPHSIVTFQLIQQLGRAAQSHDAARVQSLRGQIEAQFLVPAIRYDVVRSTYTPVMRWESGQALKTEPVASYNAGEP